MLGFLKKKKNYVDSDYMNLKETIWSLQAVAYALQETAEKFEKRLEDLKRVTNESTTNKGQS